MHRGTRKSGAHVRPLLLPFALLLRSALSLWAALALGSVLVLVPATFTAAAAATAAPTEYQVKAVFIYNFSRFVSWPAGAFVEANEPFVIGILGEDPFGNRLDDVVRGEQVNQHPLVVHRFSDVGQIGDCRILFIDRSEQDRLGQILAALDHRSVLTVSDIDDASERGVMIQLDTQADRVHLRINVDSVRAAGLTISSNLLRLAQIVRTGN